MAGPSSVEAYLSALPAGRRAWMEELRETIRAAAPEATEAISYLMPAFRLRDRFLVSYAAYKSHYSLFPANQAVVAALGDELKGYYSGRGTLRFPADEPLRAALVTKVVHVRIAEENAKRTTFDSQ